MNNYDVSPCDFRLDIHLLAMFLTYDPFFHPDMQILLHDMMGVHLDPQFDILHNCTNFTTHQLKNINLARSLSGLVCMAVVLLILVVIVFYKAYKTTLQRLFLYITAATVFEEAAFSLAIEHQFYYTSQDKLCTIYGFFLEWTVSITNYLILCKIFYLFYLICVHCRGSGGSLYRKKYQWLVEGFCLLFAICFPLTYIWIPFLHGTYNLAGGWCWIKTIDKNCKNVGLKDEIIFGYGVFETVGIITIVLTVLFAILYCRLAYLHRVVRHQHLITLRQTIFLLGFLVTSVLVLSLGFAVRIYTGLVKLEEEYALWIMLAIAPPFYQIIYPLGFLVYLYTLKKFNQEALKKAWKEWNQACVTLTKCRCEFDEYAEQCDSQSDEPFILPHEYHGHINSEHTPLLRASDMGYNSLS